MSSSATTGPARCRTTTTERSSARCAAVPRKCCARSNLASRTRSACVPSCANCGSRLPKRSRFCPECGTRVGAGPGETAVQELPPQETGPVPVELSVAAPRFFGVTPPAAVLALAAASLALAIVLFVSGHVIVGGALLGVAVVLALFFVGLARRLP